MPGAVGFLISVKYKFSKKSYSEFFLNRLGFDRIIVMSLWPCIWPTLYTCIYRVGQKSKLLYCDRYFKG